jgi:hypothetical protein
MKPYYSLVCVALLAGCVSTAKMSGPAEQLAIAKYPVQGANPFAWKKPMLFGRWHTQDMTDYGRVDGGLKFAKLDITGTYHARRLTTNTGTTAVCSGVLFGVGRNATEIDPTLGRLPVLSCSFTGKHQAEFSLRQNHVNQLSGELVLGEARYQVESVHQIDGAMFSSAVPVGFLIKQNQTVLWSVEKLNAGQVLVWQNIAAAEQDLLATMSFVLLATDFDNVLWDNIAR